MVVTTDLYGRDNTVVGGRNCASKVKVICAVTKTLLLFMTFQWIFEVLPNINIITLNREIHGQQK